MAKKALIVLILPLILLLVIVSFVQAQGLNRDLLRDQKPKTAKMQSIIFDMADSFQKGGLAMAPQKARGSGIKLSQDNIKVVVEAKPGMDITAKLKIAGARIEATNKDQFQVMAKLGVLKKLAAMPEINYVRLPLKPYPIVVNEGVKLAGADTYHEAGYKGKDSKVAVLDFWICRLYFPVRN